MWCWHMTTDLYLSSLSIDLSNQLLMWSRSLKPEFPSRIKQTQSLALWTICTSHDYSTAALRQSVLENYYHVLLNFSAFSTFTDFLSTHTALRWLSIIMTSLNVHVLYFTNDGSTDTDTGSLTGSHNVLLHLLGKCCITRQDMRTICSNIYLNGILRKRRCNIMRFNFPTLKTLNRH